MTEMSVRLTNSREMKIVATEVAKAGFCGLLAGIVGGTGSGLR